MVQRRKRSNLHLLVAHVLAVASGMSSASAATSLTLSSYASTTSRGYGVANRDRDFLTERISCKDPLVKDSKLSATSSESQRDPGNAFLWSNSAWTAETQDFEQALMVDLGSEKNVTGIATQGRTHSDEYVMEFRIQYGSNGRDWQDYKDVDGMPKIFRGNVGDFIVRNDFDHPIVARQIRINPTKWNVRISLRVELYGCEYKGHVLHFDGASYLRRNLTSSPITSTKEYFQLRFKTNKENGILMYSRGSQGDYFALQLVENRMLLTLNLGGQQGPIL